MSVLAEALGSDLQGLFEYDLDDLAGAGIRLPPEQEHLLDQYVDGIDEGWALTLSPIFEWESRRTTVFWDPALDRPTLVCYPEPVRLGGGWENVSGYVRMNEALRFPGLLGRKQNAGEGWCDEEDDLDLHRPWNLWPIEKAQAEEVLEITGTWMNESEGLGMLEMYNSINRGDYDFCDLASHLGHGDVDAHEHEDTTAGDPYSGWCKTGQQAFEEIERNEVGVLVPDPNDTRPWWYPRAFPGPQLEGPLAEAWARLLRSSQAASLRLPALVPPWDQSSLLFHERWYSPWLWLC